MEIQIYFFLCKKKEREKKSINFWGIREWEFEVNSELVPVLSFEFGAFHL